MQIAREKFYKRKKKKSIADGFYNLYYVDEKPEVETEFYSSDVVVLKNKGYNAFKRHFVVINDLLCYLPYQLNDKFMPDKTKFLYEKQKEKMIKDIEKRLALDDILSFK